MSERKPIDRVCRFASWAIRALVVLHVLSFLNFPVKSSFAVLLVFWGWVWILLVVSAVRIRSGRWTVASVLLVSSLFLGVLTTGLPGFIRAATALDAVLSVTLGFAWITAWVATVRVWVRIGAKYEEDSDWIGLRDMNVGRGGYFGRMISSAGGVERHPDDVSARENP